MSPRGVDFELADAGLARLSHVSIQVRDLDRSLVFYQDVFGFQTIFDKRLEGDEFEKVTAIAGAKSRMIRGLIAGNSVVQLFWHNWREAADVKQTLLSFEVRDIHKAHERLAACCVELQSPPVEFDNSWAFVMNDPDGHPFELIQWKPDFQPYRAS